MEKELIERLESKDLKTGLSALAEVVYRFSERHGGCYVTACRCAGHDDSYATADRNGNDDYTSVGYGPEDNV